MCFWSPATMHNTHGTANFKMEKEKYKFLKIINACVRLYMYMFTDKLEIGTNVIEIWQDF